MGAARCGFRRIHENLPDQLPIARIRDDDTIIVYELRPLVIAPEPVDRDDDEFATSTNPADFRETEDSEGNRRVSGC